MSLNPTKSKCCKNKIDKPVMPITLDSEIKQVTYSSRIVAFTCNCCFETFI